MALTANEKYKAVYYLGYPSFVLDSTSIYYNSSINQNLTTITSYPETQVRTLLVGLDESRVEIDKAQARLKVTRIEEIELNQNELEARWAEDRKLVKLLGQIVGIPAQSLGGSGGSVGAGTGMVGLVV